jgi:membrane-bound lytic murein transglycosylase D
VPGAAPTATVARAAKESAPPKAVPPTGVVGPEQAYVVRRGDTLSKIATRHGLSEDKLMELNNIRNRNFVYEGQVLALADSARVAPPVEAQVAVNNVVTVPSSAPLIASEAAEPTSEREAEEMGPALVPGTQAAASADPSDYSVHADDTIHVQAAETLGHYAEWLGLRASHLRQINRMSYATPVVIGRSVKLDFAKVSRDEFEAKRQDYHRQLQEAFFAQFRINGNETHVIRSGESIWVIAQQRYNIPIWLLRQYNPDVDFGSVRPGTKLVIPLVETSSAAEPAA